mmetsp:Transcript_6501/g.8557  ORF Transcript_6501/g.8557 Transcript_6501/m.8557 type:complete len:105 (+) Transcript_6501:122-436(+)
MAVRAKPLSLRQDIHRASQPKSKNARYECCHIVAHNLKNYLQDVLHTKAHNRLDIFLCSASMIGLIHDDALGSALSAPYSTMNPGMARLTLTSPFNQTLILSSS